MKTKNSLLFVFSIVFLSFSCYQKNLNTLDQKVFEDIFPELIKETFWDMRKMLPPIPPPPPPNMTNDKEIDEVFKEYEEYISNTKFKPLYVIVADSLDELSKKDLNYFYKEKGLTFIDTTESKNTIKIDLSKIELDDNYILKYKSEINIGIEELTFKEFEKTPNLRQYSGTIGFSRIYFNSARTYGFFGAGFTCGKLCGTSYFVYVKK